jgi:hypothetical protein
MEFIGTSGWHGVNGINRIIYTKNMTGLLPAA